MIRKKLVTNKRDIDGWFGGGKKWMGARIVLLSGGLMVPRAHGWIRFLPSNDAQLTSAEHFQN